MRIKMNKVVRVYPVKTFHFHSQIEPLILSSTPALESTSFV